MPLKIETHILGKDGICSRCQLDLRKVIVTLPKGVDMIRRGDRIGLVSGLKHVEDAAYLITKTDHDSNQLCQI